MSKLTERQDRRLRITQERHAAATAERLERQVREKQSLGVRPPDWSKAPVGEGFCSPRGPRCVDARVYTQDRRPCCWYQIHETLRVTVDLLNAIGVPWWGDYGTALAAVCRGGMFPWDKDSDLGVLQVDKPKVMEFQLPVKRMGMGWRASIRSTVKVMASKANHTNCDIFSWHLERGKWARYVYADVDDFKGREFPEDWLFPLTTLDYEGITLNLPAAIRWPGETPAPHIPGFEQGSLFLEFRYGPGWMHPRRANNDEKWSHLRALEMLRRLGVAA